MLIRSETVQCMHGEASYVTYGPASICKHQMRIRKDSGKLKKRVLIHMDGYSFHNGVRFDSHIYVFTTILCLSERVNTKKKINPNDCFLIQPVVLKGKGNVTRVIERVYC